MGLTNLLRGLEARAPWISAGRPILLRAGYEIHRGFPNTISAIKASPRDLDKEDALSDGLTEHLVAGEKLVRVVALRRGERSRLERWANAKRMTASPLTDAFPGIASQSEIVTQSRSGLVSAGSVELDSGSAALYTGSRFFLERVEIPRSDLKANAAEGYEKVFGVRRTYVQTYDAIWIHPQEDVVCIATDYPRNAPKEFAEASQGALRTHLRQQLDRDVTYVNLWPAIDGLYSVDSGKLVAYGFTIAGKQVNHHKARRSTECLRKAVYDAAGAAAVGDDLELFKVAFRWKRREDENLIAEPEILLPGTAVELGKPRPTLNHFELRDSLTSRDLEFVVSKLLPHI